MLNAVQVIRLVSRNEHAIKVKQAAEKDGTCRFVSIKKLGIKRQDM